MLSRIKELGKDTLFYSIGSITSQLLSVILIPYYTEALSPEDYGKLATLALITGTISPISNLGLDSALFRHFIMAEGEEERSGYFFSAFTFKIGITVVLCLVLWPLFDQVNSFLFESTLTKKSYAIFIANFFVFNLSLITALAMRASRKARLFIIGQMLSLVVGLVLSIYFVLNLGWGFDGAQWAGLAGQIVSTGVGIWYSKQMIGLRFFDLGKLKTLLIYGTPYIAHRVQGAVVQGFTAFTINKWMGVAALGVYAVASKFSKPIDLVVNSIQKAWSPYKFHIHKTDQNPATTFSFLIANYWAVLIYGWGMACIIATYFLHNFVNNRFQGAVDILPFIFFTPVSLAFCWTVGTGYEMSDNQRRIPESSFISLVTLMVTAFLLKDFYSPIGWILAQSFSYITGGIYLYYYSKKLITIDYQFKKLFAGLIIQSFLLLIFYQSFFAEIMNSVAAIIMSTISFVGLLLMINGKGFVGKVVKTVQNRISLGSSS